MCCYQPCFIDGEVKAFIIYKIYKLVTHLSTENIPKGKTNPRQPEWTMGCIDSQEAVLVWLNGSGSLYGRTCSSLEVDNPAVLVKDLITACTEVNLAIG